MDPFPRVISMQCEVKLKGWEKAGPLLAPAFWMGPAHQEMVSHKMGPIKKWREKNMGPVEAQRLRPILRTRLSPWKLGAMSIGQSP